MKLHKHRLSLFVVFCLMCVSEGFSEVSVRAMAQPQEATVGDPIQLEVKLFYSSDVDIKMLDRPGQLGPFEVQKFLAENPIPQGGAMERRFLFRLATFEVGMATIPPVTISYVSEGETKSIETQPIPIHVRSVLTPESKDILDIRGAIRPQWLNILLIAVGVLTLAIILFVVLRKRKKILEEKIEAPRPPAHEEALSALQYLESLTDRTAKAFYSRLSEILRVYLERRFDVTALDRTTTELFQEMRSRHVASGLCVESRDILEVCDLVKFAKFEPADEERTADLDRVRQFVMTTRPAIPVMTQATSVRSE
jgi:hypothetical protein